MVIQCQKHRKCITAKVAKFRLLTGHDCLCAHLFRFNLVISPICVLCDTGQDMTAAHLDECSALHDLNCIVKRSASENSRIAEPLTDDYESYKKHEDDSISVVKRSFQSSHHDIHKCDQFPIEPSSDEIRLLKGEILVLNKALEMEIEKRENAEEKCLRLERLVNVLQRKVNGQNVGISV
ncbi:uncharacterized protein TNCV_3681691 [Trichonephila clavipes]|uniref:Uncharacterized protein n=1 Tax=Trichonephila clavipes TaxID=2585209 RepID=A0A8X6RAT5_TRICX|nr:uncharacterized protein TNCV_3681691 [Trichonephila clavipes]